MIIDGEKITELASNLLNDIDCDNNNNKLIEIDDVFIIAVVHYGNPDEYSSCGSLFYRCSSAKHHVQLGILSNAKEAVKNVKRL